MSVIKLDNKIFNHDAQSSGFTPESHVDLCIDFKRFITMKSNNYILEGIRGTGKTHILKMIITEATNNLQELKVVPSYVTIAKAPQIAKEKPEYFRIFLYASIIKSICDFIVKNEKNFISRDEQNLIKKIVALFNIRERRSLHENIKEIKKTADNIINELYDKPEKIVYRIKRGDIIGGGIEAGTPLVGASVNIEEINEDEMVKEYTTKKLSDIYGVDILMSFLITVKKLLQLNYIYILLDECSELTKEMQIEVFRLCKQIRASAGDSDNLSSPSVAFMAAVYPLQSTYYPATSKGDDFNFQPGHDCTLEYLEMDELNEEFVSFFKELISKRIQQYAQNIQMTDIFENDDVVAIAAFCSGGVPRRFFEIIKQAYNQLIIDHETKDFDGIKKIDINYIISAVSKVVEGPSLLNNNNLDINDNETLEKIIKRFAKRNKGIETRNTGQKTSSGTPIHVYFVTAIRSIGELAKLIATGIIHDKKRTRSRKSGLDGWRGSGILCSLDFGVAVHRGVVTKNPQRLIEICKTDLMSAASGGFSAVLDITLEEETAEIEYDNLKEYLKNIEERQLELDDLFMAGKIPEKHYGPISERFNRRVEITRKRLQKMKEKIEERKKK